MAGLPAIPGAKKKGVLLFSGAEDLKKLDEYLINDTVCIDGPGEQALQLARVINEKYKVGVKVCSAAPRESLPADIEAVDSPIQEIVGEGRAEAVKFKNGKAVGVSLVVLIRYPALSDRPVCPSGQHPALSDRPVCPSGQGEDMSDVLVDLGTKGAQAVMDLARKSLNEVVAAGGKDKPLAFPETNYYLPLACALLNIEIKTAGDCLLALREAESLNKNSAARSGLIINSLGGILNKGIATLICEEILAALAVQSGQHPLGGIGFIPDKILRSLGLQLVDGRISGIAVILGPAKDDAAAVGLIREFQSKSIVSLLAGSDKGTTFQKQLENKGIELGLENYIVPLGEDYLSAIYAVNFAVRAPLTYGGYKPGQWQGVADYVRNRVPAFVLLLSHVDEVIVATGLGVLAFGLPIITDLDVPQLGKIDTTLFEALVVEKDYAKIPEKCILARGIKVKTSKVAIPVPYASAFEGERVRREQMQVEFGGKASLAFEYLSTKAQGELEDGKITLVGPDIDQLPNGTKSLPLAIVVDVWGRKMQKDFEPILERQIHRFVNYAMGLMHVGQRDMNWIRISRDAFDKGFRLKDIGVILHAMLHQEYSAIVDKVQVNLYTEQADVEKFLAAAKKTYEERDERLSGMTDESVDAFYSCTLCVPKGENIIFSDGSFKKIEDVINDEVEFGFGGVVSLNSHSFQTQNIGELFINPAPRSLIKVNLNSGNSLALTANHKVLVDKKEGLIWQEAAKLKPNDSVISAAVTNIENRKKQDIFYIIDFLPLSLKVYDNDFVDYLKEKILAKYKSIGSLAKEMGIDYGKFYYVFYNKTIHKRRLTLQETRDIIVKLGLSWDTEKLKINSFGTTRSSGYRLLKNTLDEDLLYLAGLVASDGSVIKRLKGTFVQFTNTEGALIEKFDEIIYSLFGIHTKRVHVKPRISRSKGLEIESKKPITVLLVNNSVIGRIMMGLGIGLRNEKNEKWTGETISRLPDNLVVSFLRGLFDGDGHVTKTHLLISSGPYRQAQHTMLLLKKIGISSYITKITRGFQTATRNFSDYRKFREIISSCHPEKKAKMDAAEFHSDARHVVRSESVPLQCHRLIQDLYLKYKDKVEFTKLGVDYKSIESWRKAKRRASKEKLKLFLDSIRNSVEPQDEHYKELLLWVESNIIFEKIRSIEKIKYSQREVYNFSVTKNHNYLVNGIVVKNCQSFAPNHVCIVTPERLGLCGAYSWLDAKAAFEITPTGPNQPITKGDPQDARLGQWANVNSFVMEKSNKTIEKVSMYSLTDSPQSSCGCFECIIAVIPEANGVMLVHRDYSGMTPCGMSFTTLAGSVGGGAQTPGFLGIGKLYILSKKFILAEGGLKRVVWMPKELKELLGEKLKNRCAEIGEPGLLEKIADESAATTSEELVAFLQKAGHPALEMEAML